MIADSALGLAGTGTPKREDLPPGTSRGPLLAAIDWLYDRVLALLPHPSPGEMGLERGGAGAEWQPNVKGELKLASADRSREMPPYIRRTEDNRLLVTVAEPVQRDKQTVGIILLTREAREVDSALFADPHVDPRAVRPGACC